MIVGDFVVVDCVELDFFEIGVCGLGMLDIVGVGVGGGCCGDVGVIFKVVVDLIKGVCGVLLCGMKFVELLIVVVIVLCCCG